LASGALTVVTVVAVVGLIWTTAVLAPWRPVRERASRPPDAAPWTAVNPVGVNTFLAREVEPWKRERTVEMVAQLGAGWIKEHFAWNEIEPEDDTYWDAKYQQDAWAKYDHIVGLAEQHGLRIIARIDQTPAWARPLSPNPGAPPVDVVKFGDFIEEFVRHYQGRVGFLQIWNEPNLASEWGGSIDPAGYVAMLTEASRRAKSVDPNVVILSAPMAMTTENSARAMDELSYWSALYELGVGSHFDIVSANAYGLDRPFDDPADADTLNIRRVELLHALVDRNDPNKAIWLNEYGWNAAPADFPSEQLIWSRVNDAEQAAWTVEGIEYARSAWPWFGVASIWYFRQVGDISPQRPEYYFRMVDLEFTPRDVYWQVETYARRQQTAYAGIYQELEAPIRAFGVWTPVRDASATDGVILRGGHGDSILIQADGSELQLALAEGQPSATLVIDVYPSANLDGAPQRHNVVVAAGQEFIDLSLGPATQSQRVRAVRIGTTESSSLWLDSIQVGYSRSYRDVLAMVALLLVALAARLALRRWSQA
jgi:hypothetical protein